MLVQINSSHAGNVGCPAKLNGSAIAHVSRQKELGLGITVLSKENNAHNRQETRTVLLDKL
jgi:hypothetical protein